MPRRPMGRRVASGQIGGASDGESRSYGWREASTIAGGGRAEGQVPVGAWVRARKPGDKPIGLWGRGSVRGLGPHSRMGRASRGDEPYRAAHTLLDVGQDTSSSSSLEINRYLAGFAPSSKTAKCCLAHSTLAASLRRSSSRYVVPFVSTTK